MNILVTGSEGFLGKHLCKLLEEKGHMVEKVDMELGISVKQYCEKPRFKNDFIIHLAAHTQVGWCWKHPQEAMANNVSATLDMLNLAAQQKTPIIVVTSDKVFAGGVLTFYEYSKKSGYCPYSASKVACDQIAVDYGRFVIPKMVNVVRFSNLIGADDHNEARLFPQIRKALQGDMTLPYAKRDCVRGWLDVRDAARALVELMLLHRYDRIVGHRDFNIIGADYSVGETIEMFEERSGRKFAVLSGNAGYYELKELKVGTHRKFCKAQFQRIYSLSDTIDHCLAEWGIK